VHFIGSSDLKVVGYRKTNHRWFELKAQASDSAANPIITPPRMAVKHDSAEFVGSKAVDSWRFLQLY
jgi:hypothetical protein